MPVRVRCRSARLSLLAAGFATVVLAGPVWAEDGFHLLDSAARFMNLKTDPGAMPDFVEQSRHDKAANDYLPVGSKPPERTLKVRTPAEVKAMTADLDAARAAQLAGKRPKPAGSGAPAKPAAAVKAPKVKTATDR